MNGRDFFSSSKLTNSHRLSQPVLCLKETIIILSYIIPSNKLVRNPQMPYDNEYDQGH